ncbi:hypothetical protein JA9_002420 [Meyerozyma sp. JA9]|nr:hypothetical protein JA9_002420 [Meyerozyma sp. JA9]
MPDLFDNFFTKIGSTMNGGKTRHHYSGATQVNTGRFYSYHENGSNNNSWLPTSKSFNKATADLAEVNKGRTERMNSVNSMSSEEGMTSRKGSIVEE